MELFLVGGAVRDEIMGTVSKDWDFSVVLSPEDFINEFEDPFVTMKASLLELGFQIFLESPQFFTIRARGPKGFTFAGRDFGRVTFDFVLARKESEYTDGRRPDSVVVGTLLDDLSRRDFSCNAIAKDADGNLIDPFDGQKDIKSAVVRAVGDPDERIKEDSLRILRAIRFMVTKNMNIDQELREAITRNEGLLVNVSVERVREELLKMFMDDTLFSMTLLMHDFWGVGNIVFGEMGIRLKPTLEK